MSNYYEAEVIIGIEAIAIQELNTLKGINSQSISKIRNGFIRFRYKGRVSELNNCRSIIAIYSIQYFDIPRPKAFLGHENFTRINDVLSNITRQWVSGDYTLGLSAAGSDSSVMQRIKHEFSATLALPIDEEDKGNLFIRLMPAYKQQGWELLVRLTPKPLSTRPWRIQNIPGALNATVAHAMLTLADIHNNATILNICSGTATILIEQAHNNNNSCLIALDHDASMLNAATKNIAASKTESAIVQMIGEAQQTPFLSNAIDYMFADLPFGHHMGSHEENEWLYPAILAEADRIAKSNAKFIAITHEIQLMQESLQSSQWRVKKQIQINLSGLHPHIFILERTSTKI